MGWVYTGDDHHCTGLSRGDLAPLLDRLEQLEERVHALDGLPPELKPKPQPVRGPEFRSACPHCRAAAGKPHAGWCQVAGGGDAS